jgi:hypothetical protein
MTGPVILESDEIGLDEIEALLTDAADLVRIRAFVNPHAAARIARRLERHPSHAVYRNTTELERVGESHFETHDNAISARSAQDTFGRERSPSWRCTTASWWRSRRISASPPCRIAAGQSHLRERAGGEEEDEAEAHESRSSPIDSRQRKPVTSMDGPLGTLKVETEPTPCQRRHVTNSSCSTTRADGPWCMSFQKADYSEDNRRHAKNKENPCV